MKRKKALCILNPVAGKLRAPQALMEAVQKYIGGQYEVSFFLTAAPGDATEAAASAGADVSLLVCCGGDGTLNEVLAGMRKSSAERAVFYIPCGTANDFAKTLGLPARPEKCASSFPASRPVPVDAGLFNQTTYFAYIAAFGAFTEVSYQTSQASKNRLGYLAYLSHFFQGLFRVRSHRLTVYADGERMEGRYLFGSITNSLSIGGVLKLDGQGVSLADGKLELLLVERPRTILLLPYVGLKLLLKKYNTKGILLKQCAKVSFQFENQTAWTIDGEYGGKTKHVDIENIPRCYQVYCNH